MLEVNWLLLNGPHNRNLKYAILFLRKNLVSATKKTLILQYSHVTDYIITLDLPWVPEVFLACGGNFWCWPKADTSSAIGRSHEKS